MFKYFLMILLCLSFVLPGYGQTRPSIYQVTKPLVYVEEHGAKGDGLTDDSNSIIAAIKHALDEGYDVALSSDRTYKITKSIPMVNTAGSTTASYEVALVGNGATIKCGESYTDVSAGFAVGDNTTVRFTGINFLGYREDLVAEDYTNISATYSYLAPTYTQHIIKSIRALSSGAISVDACTFSHVLGNCLYIGMEASATLDVCDTMFRDISFNCVYAHCNNVEARVNIIGCSATDVGLLPDTFKVDGVEQTFDGGIWNQPNSYGFLSIGGTLKVDRSTFTNYTASAICSVGNDGLIDSRVIATNNIITSNSSRCRFWDTPSAIFLESSLDAIITGNLINLQLRNASDASGLPPSISGDLSSAIYAFIEANGRCLVSNNIINVANSSAKYGIFSNTLASSSLIISNNIFTGTEISVRSACPSTPAVNASLLSITDNYFEGTHAISSVDQTIWSNNSGALLGSTQAESANGVSYIATDSTEVFFNYNDTPITLVTLNIPEGIWLISANVLANDWWGAIGATTISICATSTLNTMDSFTTNTTPTDLRARNTETSPDNLPVNFSGIYQNSTGGIVPLRLNVDADFATSTIGLRGSFKASRIH